MYQESSHDESDDSCDSEEYTRLKKAAIEITRSQCTRESKHDATLGKTSQTSLLPSLRTTSEDVNKDQHELETTPELRAHIAKKLTQILDRSVDIIQKRSASPERMLHDDSPIEGRGTGSPGVKLFAASKKTVSGDPVPSVMPQRKKRPPSSSECDSDEELAKFASAAVSGEYILKQAKILPSWTGTITSGKNETKPNENGDNGTKTVEQSAGNKGDPNTNSDMSCERPCRKKKKKQKRDIYPSNLDIINTDNSKESVKVGQSSQDIQNVVRNIENRKMKKKSRHESIDNCNYSDASDTCSANSSSVLEEESGKISAKRKNKNNGKEKLVNKCKTEGATPSPTKYVKKKKCKHRHSEKI